MNIVLMRENNYQISESSSCSKIKNDPAMIIQMPQSRKLPVRVLSLQNLQAKDPFPCSTCML